MSFILMINASHSPSCKIMKNHLSSWDEKRAQGIYLLDIVPGPIWYHIQLPLKSQQRCSSDPPLQQQSKHSSHSNHLLPTFDPPLVTFFLLKQSNQLFDTDPQTLCSQRFLNLPEPPISSPFFCPAASDHLSLASSLKFPKNDVHGQQSNWHHFSKRSMLYDVLVYIYIYMYTNQMYSSKANKQQKWNIEMRKIWIQLSIKYPNTIF